MNNITSPKSYTLENLQSYAHLHNSCGVNLCSSVWDSRVRDTPLCNQHVVNLNMQYCWLMKFTIDYAEILQEYNKVILNFIKA